MSLLSPVFQTDTSDISSETLVAQPGHRMLLTVQDCTVDIQNVIIRKWQKKSLSFYTYKCMNLLINFITHKMILYIWVYKRPADGNIASLLNDKEI